MLAGRHLNYPNAEALAFVTELTSELVSFPQGTNDTAVIAVINKTESLFVISIITLL